MSGGSTDHVVASADDIEPGDHVVVDVDGREVGVFNVDGEFHAYANWCPHHGGPVCAGALDGTTVSQYDRESLDLDLEWVKVDEVLRCPWHGWEFDVQSGESLHADDARLVEYEARVEGGDVVLRR